MIHFEKILALIWPKFVEANSGRVFIEAKSDKDHQIYGPDNIDVDLHMDHTAIEATINHIHLNDILLAKNLEDRKRIARIISEIWLIKLNNNFPNRHFRIHLTCEEDVVLRFHQIHDAEPPWLNEVDWQEAVSKGKVVIWET